MKKIILSVNEFGQIAAVAKGFVGGACKQPTSVFAKAIGGKQEITPTSEASSISTTQSQNETQLG